MGGVTTTSEQPKVCTECRETKPPGAFAARTGLLGGRMDVCRWCMKERRESHRTDKSLGKTILRDAKTNSRGDFCEETYATRRDQYIILLAAACDRYRQAEEAEDRDGAREALLFRCRQLIEAEGLVST
jgi:hypothetical protein